MQNRFPWSPRNTATHSQPGFMRFAAARPPERYGSSIFSGRFGNPAPLAQTVPEKTIKAEEKEEGEVETICQRHQELLKLFCKDDQTPICVVCDKSKLHQGHKVLPIEEATQDYNKEIQDQLELLKKEKERILSLKSMGAARSKESLELITSETQRTLHVFEEAYRCLEDQKQLLLGQWKSLQVTAEERQEAHAAGLSEDVLHLESLIEEAGRRRQHPDPSFLQEMKTTLTRCKKRKRPESMEIFSELQDRIDCLARQNTAVAKKLKKVEDSLSLEGATSHLESPVVAETSRGAKNVKKQNQKNSSCNKNKKKPKLKGVY